MFRLLVGGPSCTEPASQREEESQREHSYRYNFAAAIPALEMLRSGYRPASSQVIGVAEGSAFPGQFRGNILPAAHHVPNATGPVTDGKSGRHACSGGDSPIY